MNTYEAKYQYIRAGSSTKNLASVQVKAESQEFAYKLAANQARSKHAGCEILVLDVRKR